LIEYFPLAQARQILACKERREKRERKVEKRRENQAEEGTSRDLRVWREEAEIAFFAEARALLVLEIGNLARGAVCGSGHVRITTLQKREKGRKKGEKVTTVRKKGKERA
jgi:hypothetical protein